MKDRHTMKRLPILLALLLSFGLILAAAQPITAQPTAELSTTELLEKAIYTEETVGDLPAAIDIYTHIVEADEANRGHVAQAQFRLGMCHAKRGDDAAARAAWDRLIADFPEQEALVSQAQAQLASVQPEVDLAPVPWTDGEFLTYEMSLPTGKVLGSLFLMAQSTTVDGIEAWQLQIRRFGFNQADNYGVSRTLVEAATQRPLRSSIRHGILGHADAVYGPDGVTLTADGGDTFLDFEYPVYDNDQSMHHTRMLPLEVGYEAQLHYLPIWTGKAIEVGLKVKGTEQCRVPAGDFECFKVALDIGQTLWISTGPERYPVKVQAEGVTIKLASIGRTEPGAPVSFALQDFGLSGTLPTDWLSHTYRPRTDKAMVRFLDPAAAAISAIEVDRCPPGRCPTLEETAQRELAGAKRRFQDFELRQESWTERTIDGRDAISFVGTYQKNDASWVQYRIYTVTDDLRLELIFRTPAERFEEQRATFDAITESLRAKSSPLQ